MKRWIGFLPGALLGASVFAQTGGEYLVTPGPTTPLGRRVSDVASLNCSYLDIGNDSMLSARLDGAMGPAFAVFLQLGHMGTFQPQHAVLVGTAPLNEHGTGTLDVPMGDVDDLPVNFEIELYARYAGPLGETPVTGPIFFQLNPRPVEYLDFDWNQAGEPISAGTPVAEQWSELGVHVRAQNNHPGHPDLAIVFDSSAPTGGDFDLATPGPGWQNDVGYGNLLIIAENDYDGDFDGIVDTPDDEAAGGTIFFEFDAAVTMAEISLIDIDPNEAVAMRCYAGTTLVQDLQIPGMGDNAAEVIGFASDLLSGLEVEFQGSGGIGRLALTPCPIEVGFDRTTTGVPTGLQAGAVLRDQFEPTLGFRVSATSHVPGTDEAAVFDTAHPTGGDFDLATPGYHPTNVVPYGDVMILAENDIDANRDGLIDEPADDANGGVLAFDFDYDVVFESAAVLDIDSAEYAYFTAFDAFGNAIGVYPLASLGDNSLEIVSPSVNGVRRIELYLSGSGALADLTFCREETIGM